MRKYAAVAAAAAIGVLIFHSAAQAVDVTYYNASEEYARKIGRYFEEAPVGLKARMYNARLVVVGDGPTLAKVQRQYNSPKSDVAKFSNGYFVAVTYKGVPRIQPRSMMFVQNRMMENDEVWQRNIVLHEMMHLFDGHPSIKGQGYISDSKEFQAAFKADKEDYEKWLAWLPEQWEKEQLKQRLGYFFSAPVEAFAEAGARAIRPLEGEKYKGTAGDFNHAFKRVNTFVKKQLNDAGIYVVADAPKFVDPPKPAAVSHVNPQIAPQVKAQDPEAYSFAKFVWWRARVERERKPAAERVEE
jgi:hypothetical protein